MKQLLKRVLRKCLPETTEAYLSARSRKMNQRFVESTGSPAITRKLVAQFGSNVLTGPFRGLRLTETTYAEHLGPFLLGTYESELHPTWERLVGQRFAQILDVGAKFGYYAVGLALRFPESKVLAFDTDSWARRAVEELALANGTAHVESLGFCSPAWLGRHLFPGSLILSDCEGYENVLFADRIPALDSCTLVIETHDPLVPGTSGRMRDRFRHSHDCEVIPSRPAQWPAGIDHSFVSADEQKLAVNEMRPTQDWLVFTPKESHGN